MCCFGLKVRKVEFTADIERESLSLGMMTTEVSMCSLTPDEERILIKDIALASEAKSKEGDTFFLITQRYTQFNSLLFSSNKRIVL